MAVDIIVQSILGTANPSASSWRITLKKDVLIPKIKVLSPITLLKIFRNSSGENCDVLSTTWQEKLCVLISDANLYTPKPLVISWSANITTLTLD